MIRKFFRNRRIRLDAGTVKTGFLPLDRIHSVAVVLDATSPNVGKCANEISDFCAMHNMTLTLLYLDMRNFRERKEPLADPGKTLPKNKLNWFGKPDRDIVDAIVTKPVDLYICLSTSDMWCVNYLSECARARFKIGRKAYKGDPYNLVMKTPTPTGETKKKQDTADVSVVFCEILELLGKIE